MDQEQVAKQETKKMTYVAILTLVVVAIYGVGALYSLIYEGVTFKEFSATMGPLAGLMVGYWVRDTQTQQLTN